MSGGYLRGRLERARDAYARAVDTMVDSNGKLISTSEMTRRQDQLRLDALNATTEAEKAAVAERKKALDLTGKPLTALDAGAEISRASVLSRVEAESKKAAASRSARAGTTSIGPCARRRTGPAASRSRRRPSAWARPRWSATGCSRSC